MCFYCVYLLNTCVCCRLFVETAGSNPAGEWMFVVNIVRGLVEVSVAGRSTRSEEANRVFVCVLALSVMKYLLHLQRAGKKISE
jgi:hypothetical protein